MKTLKPFYLLFFSLLLISCDDTDDVNEIDFTQTITTDLGVDIPSDSNGTFTTTETIDFTTIQEIQDNIDEIQDATIDSLGYEVDNFVGAANTTVTSASINFNGTTIQVSNINLEQADNNNTVFSIDDPAALSAIENALQNDTQATVTLSGSIDSVPASFDVIIYLDVTITSSLN